MTALSSRITSVETLHSYLHAAMQLEHATIPPYLTALYSIHPNTNLDANTVIRVVAVEEMLHLTLAANLLNAVGGEPDLTAPDFVPTYPAYLPDGETDFQVGIAPFSRETVETFLKIERPDPAPDEEARVREHYGDGTVLASPEEGPMRFYSIGDFYEEIHRGLVQLHDELGDELFCGDPARQATTEYYYSGGGDIVPVTDLDSAAAAIRLISEQGEGVGGAIFDYEGELAHYYRFQQLLHGRYYQVDDKRDNPTGPELDVEWDAVYPVKPDLTLEDLRDAPDLYEAAVAFNRQYADFLGLLTRAYTGQPNLLIEAVVEMFRVRDGIMNLVRNPIPGTGVNAGPTFEVNAA